MTEKDLYDEWIERLDAQKAQLSAQPDYTTDCLEVVPRTLLSTDVHPPASQPPVPQPKSDQSTKPLKAAPRTVRIDQVHMPAALDSIPPLSEPKPELIRQMRLKMQSATGVIYGYREEFSIFYTPVPAKLAQRVEGENLTCVWRIQLRELTPNAAPMGFDVLGDVVIGLSQPGDPAPDIDLAAFKGREQAVSRRHAMLRPTRNHLYLIDLDSTNGTRINMAPVGRGAAVALSKLNTITLGDMTFTLKIVSGPEG